MANEWSGEREQMKQYVTWSVTGAGGMIAALYCFAITHGQISGWDRGARAMGASAVVLFLFMIFRFVVCAVAMTPQHRAHRRELWRMWIDEQSAESKWKKGAEAELARKRDESDAAGKQEELRQYQVRMARKEAVAFYYHNAFLLADDCPVPLFRSMIEAQISVHMTAEDAWKGSRDAINSLKPLVASARQRQLREEHERQQELHRRKQETARRNAEVSALGKEIGVLKARLQKLAKSPAEADIKEIETEAIARRIAEIREQQATVVRNA